MKPSKDSVVGKIAETTENPLAVFLCYETLKKRADFLRAARAQRISKPGFILQYRRRDPAELDSERIRVGFTCSKKVGNAIARNRAKRRLREIARATLPVYGAAGHDYVLIGRQNETEERSLTDLSGDLVASLNKAHTRGKT